MLANNIQKKVGNCLQMLADNLQKKVGNCLQMLADNIQKQVGNCLQMLADNIQKQVGNCLPMLADNIQKQDGTESIKRIILFSYTNIKVAMNLFLSGHHTRPMKDSQKINNYRLV
jgi:hypothetical protein